MRHNVFRYLLAVVLIGIGVLLVLENIGIATFDAGSAWINLYPVLFIVYGIKTIIDRMRYRGGSWMFGSFLFIFGTLLMLDRFGVFEFVFNDIFKLWPLLIIYLGFTFIRPKGVYIHTGSGNKGKKGNYYGPYDYTKYYDGDNYKKYYKDKYGKGKYHKGFVYDSTDDVKHDTSEAEANANDTNDTNQTAYDGNTNQTYEDTNARKKEQNDQHKTESNTNKNNYSARRKGKSYSKGSFFSIGDFEYSQDNWKVEPMHLSNLAGDFYLDFTKAFIPEKEIPISISALAGDVRILMPENIEFRVEAQVKAGDINVLGQTVDGINRSLFFETDNYHSATRKLDFSLKLKAGSVRIDHV